MVIFKHEHARGINYHLGIDEINNCNESLQLFQNQKGRLCDVQT
jgi:hypothetical protein